MNLSEGIITAVISAAVATGTTLVTSSLTYFNASRELDIRMVNVALTILSAKEKGTETVQARRYALRALEQYGGVEIPDAEFEAWAQTGSVPTGDFPAGYWTGDRGDPAPEGAKWDWILRDMRQRREQQQQQQQQPQTPPEN